MELLEQIEAHLTLSGTSPSTFGRMAVGDPRFVQDLRSGRRPRLRTLERVNRYLNGEGMDGELGLEAIPATPPKLKT